MDFDFTSLVQLGFHGTALAFLMLGYGLLRQVLNEPPADDPNNEKLGLMMRNIRFFIVASVIFLVIGVAAQIYFDRTERPVEVHLSPTSGFPEGVAGPKVMVREQKVVFVDGRGHLKVRENDSIRVVIDELIRRLHDLEFEIRAHESVLASEFEGGGFDENAG